LGKKQYCIRISPEDHRRLVQMAKSSSDIEDRHLSRLLEEFALSWDQKMKLLRSNNAPIDSQIGHLLLDTFDAQRALEILILRIERDSAIAAPGAVSALRKVKLLSGELVTLIDQVISG